MRPWLPSIALFALLIGCNPRAAREGIASPTQPADQAGSAPHQALRYEVAPKPAAAPMAQDATLDAGAPADELPRLGGGATDSAAAAMIIRTGTATVEVDSLEPAVAQLHQLATRLGGYVANSSMQGGRQQLRQAMLELKIPAGRYDEAASGLGSLGTVEATNSAAEDVGEEYTDVAARVANAQRLEQRLADLLASRTGKLQDVLAVERELARVRETIERYEGRLRYLRTHAAMSTLAVTLHEPPLLTAHPGRNVIVEAFIRAWRNFVALVATLIASLGIVVPLAAAAVAAGFAWRRFRARPPRRDPAAP